MVADHEIVFTLSEGTGGQVETPENLEAYAWLTLQGRLKPRIRLKRLA